MTTTTESETMAHHQAMVVKMADRYSRAFRMVDRDDLIQEGMFALLTASRRYDPSRGAGLMTYAWKLIKQQMRRVIGVNRTTHKLQLKEQHLHLEHQVRPNDSRTFLDILGTSATQENDSMATETRAAVSEAMAVLSDTERAVIVGRFVDDRTLADLGAELGVTRQRVEQAEKRALGKLRDRLLRWHRMAA
jgi:RNA polymerase sigma factor (sigma-70 family)